MSDGTLFQKLCLESVLTQYELIDEEIQSTYSRCVSSKAILLE